MGDRAPGVVGRWPATAGAFTGLVIGVFVYQPLAFGVRRAFDIAVPDPMPPLPLWEGLYKGSPAYWASWALCLVICVLPGIAGMFRWRTRRFGVGYVVAVIVAGVLGAATVSSFYIGGALLRD